MNEKFASAFVSSKFKTLFLSEKCPTTSYTIIKIVTAIMKLEKLSKIWTSALIYHLSQASQDDSEKKTSDLLSSFFSDSEIWQDVLRQCRKRESSRILRNIKGAA